MKLWVEIFNVGSGKQIAINELAETIVELSGSKSKITHDQPRAGDIKDSYANISKAQKLLNYHPRVSLTTGLQQLFHISP